MPPIKVTGIIGEYSTRTPDPQLHCSDSQADEELLLLEGIDHYGRMHLCADKEADMNTHEQGFHCVAYPCTSRHSGIVIRWRFTSLAVICYKLVCVLTPGSHIGPCCAVRLLA